MKRIHKKDIIINYNDKIVFDQSKVKIKKVDSYIGCEDKEKIYSIYETLEKGTLILGSEVQQTFLNDNVDKLEIMSGIGDLISINKLEVLFSIDQNDWKNSLKDFSGYAPKDIFVAFKVI